MKKNKLILHLVYIIIILMAGGAYINLKLEVDGSIKVQIGDVRIKINNVTNNTISMKDMIQQVSQDKPAEGELLALLKEESDLYQPTDPEIVNAIGELKYADKVSEGLRTLVVSHTGPFEEPPPPLIPHQAVNLSVPAGNRISQGKAASCRDNPFSGKDVTIFSKKHRGKSVKVKVSGYFDCPEKYKYLKDLIQLSYDDMKELIDPLPLHRLEEGFAEELISAQ